MVDFKIKRGLSKDLNNPKLVIEAGCWYLCTDTAELFLGVSEDGVLKLKQINGVHETGVDQAVLDAIQVEVNAVKESLNDYAKKEELPDVSDFITMQDVEDKNYLTEVPVGYATEDYVNRQIAAAELNDKDVDLEAYYTKIEVDALIPEVPTNISAFNNDAGYATEQDIIDAIAAHDNLAKKEDVLDVKTTLENEVLPKVEEVVEVVPLKANEVPFTDTKIVNKAIGGFAAGEDLKGFTIAQLFAKLLELTDEKPEGGDTPDIPADPDTPAEFESPKELLDHLISKQAPMYSHDEQGNLTETPFASSSWTEEEAAAQMDGVSTAYHITDENGVVIESGYQEATTYNEVAPLTVALPSEIKKVKVKMYDPDSSNWELVTFEIVPIEESSLTGYTIWTVPEEYEIQAGDTYRFVIIE